MTRLALHLLGTFHATIDDKPVTDFATDKARALLAYLTVERIRPHRREHLAALLWPDQPDERARQSLRQTLSHLRQALDGDAFLQITPQDVQLNPAAGLWTDVAAFLEIDGLCRGHRHRSLERCLTCLKRQEALAGLYAGEFLGGFASTDSEPFEEWLLLTREGLHRQAVRAHALLADFHERGGDCESALRHVREQVRLEPWREEAHRQAMRLLAGEDQRSAALAQFEACRQALDRELAAPPTRETIRLCEQIRDGTWKPPAPPPVPPDPGTSFVGRRRELDELAGLLADPDCRLLTLTGPGGAGKTRLGLQAARQQVGLFPDGVLFVPLAGLESRPLAAQAVADALGLPSAPDPLGQVCEFLREQEMLLVLDNFEQVVDGCDLVARLLMEAPGLQVLLTSRERLRLREEWVYDVGGLSYPADADPQGEPGEYEALVLFEQRAGQVDRRFRLTPEVLPAAVEVCRLVEGSPLGVELAASTIPDQPCAEIASALRQTLDALASSLRNVPARHRSLRAAFEHSWNLLAPAEQALLARLSIFAGGFEAEAAEAVAGAAPDQMNDLLAKSLVRRDPGGRYALHEVIRQFAAEKLERAEEVRSNHGSYYAGLTTAFDPPVSALALATFHRERLNLLFAWRWSLEAADRFAFTGQLLPGLANLYSFRGPVTEGEELLGEALRSVEAVLPPDRELAARISLGLGQIYKGTMKLDEAVAIGREVAEKAEGPFLQARGLLLWAQSLGVQGESEASRPVLERSLALGREMGDKIVESDSLRELGNAANRLGELEQAILLYEQSLVLVREFGDRYRESATLNNMGAARWDLGDLPAARQNFVDALALYRELGDRRGEAKALNNLSNVAADQGDLGESLRFSQEALRIHIEMHNRRGQCNVLHNLGSTYLELGEYADARDAFEQALTFYRESSNRQAEGEILANLCLLDGLLGEFDSGREHGRRALALATETGDKPNLANVHYYLGWIELGAGNYEAAQAELQAALDLRGEVPHPGRVAEIRVGMALLALRRAPVSQALDLLRPVLEIMDEPDAFAGTEDPPHLYARIAEVLAAARDERAAPVLTRARQVLEERAARITDPELRKSYLENVPAHREILHGA